MQKLTKAQQNEIQKEINIFNNANINTFIYDDDYSEVKALLEASINDIYLQMIADKMIADKREYINIRYPIDERAVSINAPTIQTEKNKYISSNLPHDINTNNLCKIELTIYGFNTKVRASGETVLYAIVNCVHWSENFNPVGQFIATIDRHYTTNFRTKMTTTIKDLVKKYINGSLGNHHIPNLYQIDINFHNIKSLTKRKLKIDGYTNKETQEPKPIVKQRRL